MPECYLGLQNLTFRNNFYVGWKPRNLFSISGTDERIISSPNRPDLLRVFPSLLLVVRGEFFPRLKRSQPEAGHLSLSVADVVNEWSHKFSPSPVHLCCAQRQIYCILLYFDNSNFLLLCLTRIFLTTKQRRSEISLQTSSFTRRNRCYFYLARNIC
jgi:hypothetical protein